jgi:hypothetical protein
MTFFKLRISSPTKQNSQMPKRSLIIGVLFLLIALIALGIAFSSVRKKHPIEIRVLRFHTNNLTSIPCLTFAMTNTTHDHYSVTFVSEVFVDSAFNSAFMQGTAADMAQPLKPWQETTFDAPFPTEASRWRIRLSSVKAPSKLQTLLSRLLHLIGVAPRAEPTETVVEMPSLIE